MDSQKNRNVKILSFQPYSIYQNGGSSRVLRRYYSGKEDQVHSLCVHNNKSQINKGHISETTVYSLPLQKRWMRGPLRKMVKWVREILLYNFTRKKILKAASEIEYEVLHIISQDVWSTTLCKEVNNFNKQLWVAFHDHFSAIRSPKKDTEYLWNKADRRLVISKELGDEYQKIFGKKEYEIITDGVLKEEISAPKTIDTNFIIIYFMGLLHIDYQPLFNKLADALDILVSEGLQIEFILRGTKPLSFLEGRSFKTVFKNDFISDAEITKELNKANILYLPIKFNLPHFYLYSLSTKMIGYLSASGAIFYHGPKNSAANLLLEHYESAISCTSLDVMDIVVNLQNILLKAKTVSTNAKKLAYKQFDLIKIQKQFWQS